MKHRKFMRATCVAAAALWSSCALAADLGPYRPRPPEPTYEPDYEARAPIWRGAYIGLNGGYPWGDTTARFTAPDISGTAALHPEGWFGGGQVGYNAQFGPMVLGVEADIQVADLSDAAATATPAGFAARATTDIDWFSTVRGRAGFAIDRVLVYATGGFAFADVDNKITATNGIDSVAMSGSDIETGYSVGGGLEWMLAPNLTTRVEYLFVDLGDHSIHGVGTDGNPYSARFDNDFQLVRAGLNYKF
jgi:outer membrane immunogenic protein